MMPSALLTRLSKLDTDMLGPHANALMDELKQAASHNLGMSCVVIAAAIIDIVQHEEAGPAGYMDGMAFAYAGNKAALGWLRGRRNIILHHEGPADGLMGEAPAREWHSADGAKAITSLLDYLDDLDVGKER